MEKFIENGISKWYEDSGNFFMVISDVRIVVNTIREMVNRTRYTGIDISMIENELKDEYEFIIRIPKRKKLSLVSQQKRA